MVESIASLLIYARIILIWIEFTLFVNIEPFESIEKSFRFFQLSNNWFNLHCCYCQTMRVTKQKFRVYLSHIWVSFFQVLDRRNSCTYIIKFLRIGLNERDTVWSGCFAFFLRGKKGEARRAVIIVQTYNRGKGEKFKAGSLGRFNEITKKILLSM